MRSERLKIDVPYELDECFEEFSIANLKKLIDFLKIAAKENPKYKKIWFEKRYYYEESFTLEIWGEY